MELQRSGLLEDARNFLLAFYALQEVQRFKHEFELHQNYDKQIMGYYRDKGTNLLADYLVKALEAKGVTEAQISQGLEALWDFNEGLVTVLVENDIIIVAPQERGEFFSPHKRYYWRTSTAVAALEYLRRKDENLAKLDSNNLKVSV